MSIAEYRLSYISHPILYMSIAEYRLSYISHPMTTLGVQAESVVSITVNYQ